MKVHIDINMTIKKLKKMCRSKKKRIRKKWLKNPRNYTVIPNPECLIFDGNIVCHPAVAQQVRMLLEDKQRSGYPYKGF